MKEVDKVILTKYITKQANDEEIAMAKYLIGSSQDHEELYVGMYEAWQKSIYYNTESIDPEKAYLAFLANSGNTGTFTKQFFNWSKMAIAASVLLLCTIGIYYYNDYKSIRDASKDLVQKEINVHKGSTLKTVLADGTKVWINAGSSLKFEPDFGQSSRTVYLSGEAYFDIAEGSVPFIVKTKYHTIHDIGTVFNVKAYPDDLSFETTVIEGEVSIEGKLMINSDKLQNVTVKKQQVMKLNYATTEDPEHRKRDFSELVEVKVQKLSSSQVEDYTGWTEDLLVFEGKTFQEIIKIMERRYDVEIIMQDMKLRNYEYTGSFKDIDQVEKALNILKETTNIDYHIQGRVITIRENKTL